jgi:predicted RNA binding protein YcfA (HicA-like mRNA interferase family)
MRPVERLRVLSGREVVSILEKNGFAEVRRQGSHIVMQRTITAGTITLPVPNHHELKRGTLAAIVRQSRIPREQFEEEGQ